MSTSPDSPEVLPNYAWYEGKIASWKNHKDGSLWLFEAIIDPQTFKEVNSSSGDPEIVELFEPKPGQVLRFIFIDSNGRPLDRKPVTLDADNPTTVLQKGDHFIMDATSTTALGSLAYTCLLQGVTELGV